MKTRVISSDRSQVFIDRSVIGESHRKRDKNNNKVYGDWKKVMLSHENYWKRLFRKVD